MVTTALAALALVGGVVCFALALPQPLPFAAQWLNVATTLFVFAAALGIWRLVALAQQYLKPR